MQLYKPFSTLLHYKPLLMSEIVFRMEVSEFKLKYVIKYTMNNVGGKTVIKKQTNNKTINMQ